MLIQSYILGSGRAGHAISEALALLQVLDKDLNIANPVWLRRGETIAPSKTAAKSVLFLANPHALHAEGILMAAERGFSAVASEKPFCVNADQLRALQNVQIPTAVFHVYRQMWGPQYLKQLIDEGHFGQIVTLEGRYWQASTAERILQPVPPAKGWKDDVSLSGRADTLIDIGVHWLDLACHLAGENPEQIEGWKSFAGSTEAHRDTHVHLAVKFPRGIRAMGSISKIFHGGTNGLEMNILGTRASANWNFLSPDEITVGKGRDRSVITRKTNDLGIRLPAHHSAGWLEGYVEIIRRLFRSLDGQASDFPHMHERLAMMKELFRSGLLS